jgi:hypothetical protein
MNVIWKGGQICALVDFLLRGRKVSIGILSSLRQCASVPGQLPEGRGLNNGWVRERSHLSSQPIKGLVLLCGGWEVDM